MGYTKLFNDLILSTVWREADTVRILWITMLALKDRWHKVNASLPGLADAAKITIEQCESGIEVLSSPDPYSRSTEFEGRRIEKCEGGWFILNGEKYRNKMSLDERREYQRIKQKEYRDKRKEEKRLQSHAQSSQEKTHTDTEADTDTSKRETRTKRFSKPLELDVAGFMMDYKKWDNLTAIGEAAKFYNHYESCGWVIGKNKPMKDWKASVRQWISHMKDFSNNDNPHAVPYSHKSKSCHGCGFVATMAYMSKPYCDECFDKQVWNEA